MTPAVSVERGIVTWLTGAAGLLVLAVAVVMMVVAAPARPAAHHAATQAPSGPDRQVTLVSARGPRSTRTERGPAVTGSPARAGGAAPAPGGS